MVSPFMCSEDSESDTEIPKRHVSHTTSTPEIPTATILPAPSAVVTPSSEFPLAPGIDHEESVRPLPFHHLALRYTSHHLDHFTSRSSSSHSSSDHSSSGHFISGHSLSRHASPDTIDTDSSTPSRFVHLPLARTPRSPTDSVTSSIHATRALVPSRSDLLPPRMRFKDSISPEDSVEEDIDTDVLADIEADATAVKVAVDRDVEVGVDAGEDHMSKHYTKPKRKRDESWFKEKVLLVHVTPRKFPIMAASAIIISSDSSDESMGSPPSRVILFGDIPNVIPSTSVVALETYTIAPVISSAAPVVETTFAASPTGLCGLVPYSGFDSDSPNEMVTTRPSSSHEFPITPVTAPPGIRRWSTILIRPGEAIPFGRPYRTHLNGPRKLLTARKRVGPLPARRLASRHASPRSSDHHSSASSSSSDSSPVHSLGLDASDQAHSGSSTRDVSPRLWFTLRGEHHDIMRHFVVGDSSERPMHLSSHSARPSRKRCRSPVDLVPLSTPVTGSLAPTRADLLPYSSETSIEEDAEVGPTETGVDMELGIGDGDDVGDHVEIDLRDAKDNTEV
ncbi:hypothetical protein Tco_1024929 [Tanacetum coccineum]